MRSQSGRLPRVGHIALANKRVYTFPVENPITNDDIPRIRVPRAFVVQTIIALKIGGTGTFDFELRHSANANDQGAGTLIHSDAAINNETTGVVYAAGVDFTAITVPSGDWIWLEITAASTGLARVVMAHVQAVGVERGA
jgi:hypothetical protein